MKKIHATLFSVLVSSLVFAQTWTQLSNIPGSDRALAATFTIGHYGFVGCGQIGSNTYTNDFWKWDAHTNSWSSISNYPGSGLNGCISFSINGKGYVGLGTSAGGPQTDFWEYDTATNAWTQKASFPGAGRRQCGCFVIGSKAYVVGGSPGTTPYYSDVYEYNATTNTWTQKNSFPYGVSGQIAGQVGFSIGKHGYNCGGGSGSSDYNGLWEYDTATDSWSAKPVLPCGGNGLTLLVSFVISKKAYVGTGNNTSSNIRRFWAYDTTTNTWSTIPSLGGGARDYGAAFAISNKGYVGTGYDSASLFMNDFWEYTDTTLTATEPILSSEITVKMYPNPNTGIMYLKYAGLENANSELSIIDITGREIKTIELIGTEGTAPINVEDFSDGVYFYRFTNNNTVSFNGKFVIAK